jgi:ABC-2 type transport system permease protein
MSKIWTIIVREYKENVYKKGFIIFTLLTPTLMLGAVFLPAVLSQVEVEEPINIEVFDSSGLIFDKLLDQMDGKLSDGSRQYLFKNISTNSMNPDSAQQKAKNKILSERIDGYLFIPSDVENSLHIEYYARNVGNFDLNRQIRHAVNEILDDYRLRQSGLDPEMIKQLISRVELATIKIKEGEEEKEGSFIGDYFVTLAFVMILYVTILIYGNMMMRGVLQEKNSRVIEILLSSASPFQLMLGKIIGLGSVGLTQYLIWSIIGALLAFYGSAITGSTAMLLSLDPLIFVYFILFFVLGYFLFATLYAGIGAITNSDQEAQQASFPLVFLIIIPLILMTFVVKNPESTLSTVLSIIPFFAPILMFTRVNISAPPALEIWGTIILLILTILGFIWIVARIYRIGILMYGKKPTLSELQRWIWEK